MSNDLSSSPYVEEGLLTSFVNLSCLAYFENLARNRVIRARIRNACLEY
jgi:hypothetical protein